MKTFYIETFGCQMNAHDSEKVVGTLLEKGYQQVARPEKIWKVRECPVFDCTRGTRVM